MTQLLPALRPMPRLAPRPSPALVASTRLLSLSSLDLVQAVERELAENPALERADQVTCERCGRSLEGGSCPTCGAPPFPERERAAEHGFFETPATPTQSELVLAELGPLLERGDRAVAIYLLGSIDEHGYLTTNVAEASEALGAYPVRVVRVLRLVQEAGPPGFAARDLRECLLLQLDRSGDTTAAANLVRRLVEGYLTELAHGRFVEIARALGVERADILAARDLIRRWLRPYPTVSTGSAPPRLVADVSVLETAAGLTVELPERARTRLAVSPAYERALETRCDARERAALAHRVGAARAFIVQLEQRWRTTAAVAQETVRRQQAFVRHGPGRLLPLTRAEVAQALCVHESTVSRTVAGRNVQLPSGRIIPFGDFFGKAGAPRDALAGLLAAEERPKSDAELCEDLAELGFILARRTVAKYRAQLGALPSSLR